MENRFLSALSGITTAALLFGALAAGWAQNEQPMNTREIWDTNFLSKRPGKKAKPSPKIQDDGLVGVTLWKLRPSRPSDELGVRSLIHEKGGSGSWTPDRINADTALHDGDRIRISIESARSGYLYVIDRDEYADGTKADYAMIFPELRIRGGDNYVIPGRVIELPAPSDSPSYFNVVLRRPDEVGERLTIFISPKPLEHVRVGTDRVPLTAEQVNEWIERWKGTEYHLEAKDQAGRPYSLAEKSAATGEKLLTQSDPVPQTLYRVETKPGSPLLVHLPLVISK